jgi:hypothetical protein
MLKKRKNVFNYFLIIGFESIPFKNESSEMKAAASFLAINYISISKKREQEQKVL